LTQFLPIDDVMPAVLAALAGSGQLVLQAPPGAGKTTRVPLAMLGQIQGRIVMLEPRRLAARAAAERMAQTLGEPVGQTVGYRIRGEAKVTAATRIEVVTEGILTRMIQSGPDLAGIGAVIFDEFHERSLNADLGLALCLEIRAALREDLALVVMSATLDAEPVAALMGGAPVVTSDGRAFAVETRWLDRPWSRPNQRGPRFEDAMAALILTALHDTKGSLLAFLPGEGEIRRTGALLRAGLPPDCHLHPLFGALDFKAQRAAIAPAREGRKVVLATSIAETSLTIEGVRVVVDGGLARRARFDPASGMSRLVTERVTRAEATQRQGRAGRVEPGQCYRLWTKGEEGGLQGFAPPEIASADLAPLVLECALWGARDPAELPFLTPPNPAVVAEARVLLQDLDAVDKAGAITSHGRAMAALPLHPRLAHMVLKGGRLAGKLAALLAERDILQAGAPGDLELRMTALNDPRQFETDTPWRVNRAVLERVRQDVKRLKPVGNQTLSLGAMAALAYPDRVGLRRRGDAPRYVLSGGKGAVFRDGDAMGAARLIVATDLDGDTREAMIRTAAPLAEAELRDLFAAHIRREALCDWSARDRMVRPVVQEKYGALVLSEQVWQDCPPEAVAGAMVAGIRDLGIGCLPIPEAARLWLARVEWLRQRGVDLPDCSPQGLMAGLEGWLAPYLGQCRRIEGLKQVDLTGALKSRLNRDQSQTLERLAPPAITAPTGTRLPVDYTPEQPMISVRLQELFGLNEHPAIGPDRLPLLIELLSPARRPVQTTADLPGFWQSSYSDVRKDMRGRYPRHPWPEDPTKAEPTTRVKPRGT